MSSSRPYQSQVFRFLQKQSRRLSEGYGQAWRRFALGATWGAQIVLYPVYALFQTSRLAGPQLEQTTQHKLPQLPWLKAVFRRQSKTQSGHPPSPEGPILSLLGGIRQSIASSHNAKLLQAGEEQTESAIAASVDSELLTAVIDSIQGVAAQLADRSLVLVAADNTTLDILPDHYQQELKRQITRLVADYGYQTRQARKRRLAKVGVLSLPTSKKGALLSVQLFRQVMAWVQTGPIAVSTNLFREAELVALLDKQRHLPRLSFPTLPAAVYDSSPQDFRGAVFAALRFMSNQFTGVAVAPLALPSQTRSRNTETASPADPRSLRPAIASTIPTSIQNLPANLIAALRSISSHLSDVAAAPLALPSHIQSRDTDAESLGERRSLRPAIANTIPSPVQDLGANVFSALRSISSQLAAVVTARLALPNPTQGKDAGVENPGVENLESQRFSLSGAADANSDWKTHLADRLGHLSDLTASASKIPEHQPQLSIANVDLKLAPEEATPNWQTSTQFTPIGRDWIDAQATFVEYIEHPLEKLLRWLDKAMLMVEGWLLQISKLLHRP